MTQDRVDKAYKKYRRQIPKDSQSFFKNYLVEASDDCMEGLMSLKIKSKLAVQLFSTLLGFFGVARFYLGDIALGIIRIAYIMTLAVVLMIPELVAVAVVMALVAFAWYIVDNFLTYRGAKLINNYILCTYLKRYQPEK